MGGCVNVLILGVYLRDNALCLLVYRDLRVWDRHVCVHTHVQAIAG